MFIRAVQHNSDLDAFRAEVRQFCEREMPPEVRRKQARGQHLERHEYDAWLKRLGSRGWLTGKWPKEHGGLSWQPEQSLPSRRSWAGLARRRSSRSARPWPVP